MRDASSWIVGLLAVEALAVVALVVALPRIARRGLLFGVYVGEARWDSGEARGVERVWYRSMALAVAVGLVAFGLARGRLSDALAFTLANLTLQVLAVTAYVRAHRAARRLASDTIAPAVSLLEVEPPSTRSLPFLTLGFVVLAAAAMVAYAAAHYAELPERIPVHFDLAGQPDRWAAKSPAQLLLLPGMTLALGGFMSWMGLLLAHAKRALRHPGTERSAEAQRRFRAAVGRVLCGTTVLVTAMLAALHVEQLRAAEGHGAALGPLVAVWAFASTMLALGGVAWLMVRYGQGGARLEGPGELTDGLADNRCWKWGLFYVNRDDPSLLVEKRFGLGYTINLGNPKAVALVAGLPLLLALIAVVALAW